MGHENRASATYAPNDTRPIAEVLAKRAAEIPDKPFVIFPDLDNLTYTYADLKRLAEQAAFALASIGIKAGDRVSIVLPNSPQAVTSWFGCLVGGFVDAAVSADLQGEPLRYAVAKVESSAVITDIEHLAAVIDAVSGSVTPVEILCHGYADGGASAAVTGESARGHVRDLEAVVAAAPPADLASAPIEKLSSIRFTSGSTGMPKGIMMSAGHMRASAQMFCVLTEMGADDVLYSPFPLHHVLASVTGLLATLEAGATISLASRFSASKFWGHIAACGATVSHGLDPVIAILMKARPSPVDADTTVRCMYTAAGEFSDFEQRFGVRLVKLFDMSELTVVVHYRQGEERRAGSCGRASDLFEIRISDSHDRPVPAGMVGELTVRPTAPNLMMLGYYGDAEKTVEQWQNLWFHTGDTGLLDDDGYFYFNGRVSDRIRHRGVNVSPEQVEAEAAAHPAIADCAAIAVPSDVVEDDVKLCVVLEPGTTVTVQQLGDELRAMMSAHHRPRYVEVYDALPRTETHKVRKAVLRSDGGRGTAGRTWDAVEHKWVA
jgi:crotonobetaine/carnitine-CoA ligase